MRDLETWRRLDAGDGVDLGELAALPLARRAPFLGAVAALADDPDPVIRAAVLKVLAGARGVPGVRTIVRHLGDPSSDVRAGALAALRTTARDAPMRYVHALFHGEVEIRRAALADVPSGAMELVAYLRADPACAELAAASPWPDQALPLAFDLHARGHLEHRELVDLILRVSNAELRAFVAAERGRAPAVIEAYFEAAAVAVELAQAPGVDVLDQLFAAIDATPDRAAATRALDQVVAALATKKPSPATRRAAVALLSLHARRSTTLVGACAALEPRVIELPAFPEAQRAAAAAGLLRFAWPVKPTAPQVMRLLVLAVAARDLALAASLVGLLPGRRLFRLGTAFGEEAIIAALLAGDRGWDEICRLPPETPALELAWLNRVERADADRYIALAAHTLTLLSGKRLEAFVDQMPRRHRHDALLRLFERELLGANDAKLAAVCRAMASRLDRNAITGVFHRLLDEAAGDRGPPLALVLARSLDEKQLANTGRALVDPAAARLVGVLDGPDPLPRDRELALAAIFAHCAHPPVREWAERIMAGLAVSAPTSAAPPRTPAKHALDGLQQDRIATCSDGALEDALEPALGTPVIGLASALARRAARPSVAACAALLGCADSLDAVAKQLDRFGENSRRFDNDLDRVTAMLWHSATELSPLAHARLFRWEAHDYALARWIEASGGTLAALAYVEKATHATRLAAQTLWAGIAEVIVFLRYRDRERFAKLVSEELAVYAAQRLDRPEVGVHAARIVIALVESGSVPFSAVQTIVLDRAADSDALTRDHLRRIARLEGMPAPPPVVEAEPPAVDLIEEVRRSHDLDALVAWCGHARRTVAQEAVLCLLLHGEAGQARLATLLASVGALPHPVPVLASIALWDSMPALDRARELATELPPAWCYHLCVGLYARDKDADLLARAFAAARAPADAWFRRVDWETLAGLAEPLRCAIELADSPHFHAYGKAIAVLLDESDRKPEIVEALRRFLEADSDRPLHLRRSVARRLVAYGDFSGLPVWIDEIADDKTTEGLDLIEHVIDDGLLVIARAIASAALIGGDGACSEKRMWAVLVRISRRGIPIDALLTRVLEEASTPEVRRHAAALAISELEAHARLGQVAEVFAWGVRRGVELAGRLFKIHMTAAERDFGHTRLDGSRIFVTALPMLRDEQYGRDIVEGLILHELGHHIYHRTTAPGGPPEDDPQALWKKAHDEGVGHLLNLVADEHLERNLRALDPAHGDRLKRLGAYAFHHAPQEINIGVLLDCLRGAAASALIHAELEVAFDEAAVRLRRGEIMTDLDRTGHPLARFARALRLGLGNRHSDPLIATALDLCGKDLRRLDMRGLYDLTHQLAALFGGACSVAKVFGGSEGLTFGEREDDVFGAGIDDDILQREVERILEPRRGKRSPGPMDRLQINVNPDEYFERITVIQRVRGQPEVHHRLANDVARHAARLRALLDDLGLRNEPAKMRIKGHALDKSRLRALVTRGDPRFLIARTPVRRTDLFLGTLIDCSGSMQAGDNIERARRFATLISEAVRPLRGVEARFFGFTDSVIYDAGDAADCGVSGLRSDGGNNDAAALFHAANVAAASAKRAKVLVMISDGLPTQCSAAALRGLVTTLTRRRGMVCAQVAVRPLEEECFPHHVVLDDDAIDVSVARFGRMVGDLARRVLG